MADADTAALDSRIEITLSNGHRLSVSGAFDPDAVSRLVRGLTLLLLQIATKMIF